MELKTYIFSAAITFSSLTVHAAEPDKFGTAQLLLTEEKYEEAYEIFSELASNGHPRSQYHAGSMLVRGRGVAKNCEDGIAMLKKSSKNGYGNASFAIHVLAKNDSETFCGIGDKKMAIKYREIATRQGYEF